MPTPRPVRLHVLLSEAEMATLRAFADEDGVSVADIVRRWIRENERRTKR